ADDRVEYEVGLGPLQQLGEIAAHLRERREPVDRLRSGGSRAELELGMSVDDLERLAADRAGRAEEGDPLHNRSVGSSPAGQAGVPSACSAAAASPDMR